jgi:hypothetical protein
MKHMKLYGPKLLEVVTHNHSVPKPLPNGHQEEPAALPMAIHKDLEPEPPVDHQEFNVDHDQDQFGPEDFAQQAPTPLQVPRIGDQQAVQQPVVPQNRQCTAPADTV